MRVFKSLTCSNCDVRWFELMKIDKTGSRPCLSSHPNQAHQREQQQSVLSWTKNMWLCRSRRSSHDFCCFLHCEFVSFQLGNGIHGAKFRLFLYFYNEDHLRTQLLERGFQGMRLGGLPSSAKTTFESVHTYSQNTLP